jgi:hypothetical protein
LLAGDEFAWLQIDTWRLAGCFSFLFSLFFSRTKSFHAPPAQHMRVRLRLNIASIKEYSVEAQLRRN